MGLLCDYNSASASVKLKQNINANNKVEINPNFQIKKTYKESWFEFVDSRSEKAEELFSSKGYSIKTGEYYDFFIKMNISKYEKVIVLQVQNCDKNKLIVEMIKETDYQKYFERGE